MAFYGDLLGLEINPERPEDKLPYRGAWLWIGPEMIHLMELPNPDCAHAEFRPTHGGRDRHFCIGVERLEPLTEAQKYGWQRGGAEWATKRWPKVSSAETRYADSMVRQGEDYLS